MTFPISVLLFGVARDLTGQQTITVPISQETRVGDLLALLQQQYPALGGIGSLLIAVNGAYAEAGQHLSPQDEIALIPPVSGG